MGSKLPIEMSQIPSLVGGVLQTLANILNAKDFATVQMVITNLQQSIYELQAKNLESQEKAVELQKDLLRLQAENDQLKRKIDAHDEWEQTKARYAPHRTSDGSIVYRLAHADPLKQLFCARCFSKRLIVNLQPGAPGCVGCPECNGPYFKI
jgi:FtsZ-binding cell division protein ZapB